MADIDCRAQEVVEFEWSERVRGVEKGDLAAPPGSVGIDRCSHAWIVGRGGGAKIVKAV